MPEFDTIEEIIAEINDLLRQWKEKPEEGIYTYFDVGEYTRTYPDAPHKKTEGNVFMEVRITPEGGRGEYANTYEFSTDIKGEESETFSIDLSTWSKHKLNIFETGLGPEEVEKNVLELISILDSFDSTEQMRSYILNANDIMVVKDEGGLAKEPLTKETSTYEEWMEQVAGQFYPLDIRDLPDFPFRDYYDAGEDTYATAYDMKEEQRLPHGIYE